MTENQTNRPVPNVNWSSYQTKIFDWIENGQGNAVVNAKAGSGKTFTLLECARRIPNYKTGLFLAFNKHIQQELKDKLDATPFRAKTVHSVGYGALIREINVDVKPNKYSSIIWSHVKRHTDVEKSDRGSVVSDLKKLVSLVRLNFVDLDDRAGIQDVARHYGIMLNPHLLSHVSRIIKKGERVARRTGEIDYDDMIWLPLHWNLSFFKCDWVFVDEAQDLNACQREIAKRSCKGRIIFVGDKNQSVYGFAGATTDSIDVITSEFDATPLDLNVCYRCPVSHVELAQHIVPDIEARDDAPQGTIESDSIKKLHDIANPGDFVLCRTNAPLVTECIHMIKAGIPAHIRGRNLEIRLIDILDEFSESSHWTGYTTLLADIKDWWVQKCERLISNNATNSFLESMSDYMSCIRACYHSFDSRSLSELKTEIKKLFYGDGVQFMTVHKAKGLENDRVIIIRPDLMPLVWRGQVDWERQQERNLEYIAQTRSTDTLIFLHDEDR